MKQLLKEVLKSYPELNHVQITIEKSKGDFFMAVQRHSRYNYTIEYTKVCRKFSKDALQGCISHELAHIVKSIEMNRIAWFLHLWRYSVDPSYEDKDEYETDKLTIERGYGERLLQFTKECNKLDYDVSIELKRIKSLLY